MHKFIFRMTFTLNLLFKHVVTSSVINKGYYLYKKES